MSDKIFLTSKEVTPSVKLFTIKIMKNREKDNLQRAVKRLRSSKDINHKLAVEGCADIERGLKKLKEISQRTKKVPKK